MMRHGIALDIAGFVLDRGGRDGAGLGDLSAGSGSAFGSGEILRPSSSKDLPIEPSLTEPERQPSASRVAIPATSHAPLRVKRLRTLPASVLLFSSLAPTL